MVNTNVRWAEKTTMKYHVASPAIVLKSVGILSPCCPDLAKRKINKNARVSNFMYIFGRVSTILFGFEATKTHHRGGR